MKKIEYTHPVSSDEEVMTVTDFKEQCADGSLIDDDGFGWPVKEGFYAMPDPEQWIYPSKLDRIPEDATHVLWANS